MKVIQQHIVPKVEKSIRLQEYAVDLFNEIPTKSAVKKAIKKGLILVNGKTTTSAHFVQENDVIELLEIQKAKQKVYQLELEVLFEDDYLAVINKPAGISVSGNKFATIANALIPHIQPSSQADAVQPFPVHRLDYPTSGCLIIAKTAKAKRELHAMFENHKIQKTYRAVSIGKMKNTKGEIDSDVDEKKAFTAYDVLQSLESEKFEALNLVELYPQTGRKHQLRQHLFSLGNPIMGDQKYYLENKKHKGYGLYLHAFALEFIHPFTQEKLKLKNQMPKKFIRLFPEFSEV